MKRCLIHIVTFNHGRTIGACIESLHSLSCPNDWTYSVLVSDNASTDNTLHILKDRAASGRIELIEHPRNLGFCAAHNLAIERAYDVGADAVLVLNPDVALTSNCLREMLLAITAENGADPRVGAVTPKLLRCHEDLMPLDPPIVDAAGMWISPETRHFDRGSGEIDRGQFEEASYVFGGTGAALLLSRRFIEDVAFRFANSGPNSGPNSSAPDSSSLEVFDEAFFAYREDADLAWRAALFGWKFRYVPQAVAYHVRRVLPERRNELPPQLNRFSVRNRFLMQINNLAAREAFHCLLPTAIRNLLVIGGVLVSERSSLPALRDVISLRSRQLVRRHFIRAKTRASAADVTRWFARTPQTEKLLADDSAIPIRSVSVVIINYNSGAHLEKCVNSILPLLQKKHTYSTSNTESSPQNLARHLELELVIIDNASTDGSAEKVAKLLEGFDARIVHSPHNLGFAGAVNAGATKTTGEAILILNPDVILSPASIAAQVAALNNFRSLGAVGPLFMSPSNVVQTNYCARRFPTLLPTILELLGLHQVFPRNPWNLADRYLDDQLLSTYLAGQEPKSGPYHSLERPFVVEQPSGACLLVRRSAFMQVGGFDEGYHPAWFEDVDFCRKLFLAGWLAAVTRNAQVVHEGGYSLKVITRSRFVYMWYRNLFRYWRRQQPFLAYLLIRLGAAIGLTSRALLALLNSFRNQPANDRAELRSYSVACLKSIFAVT